MARRPIEVTVDTWTGRMNEWNECADTGLPYGSAAEARRGEAVEGASVQLVEPGYPGKDGRSPAPGDGVLRQLSASRTTAQPWFTPPRSPHPSSQ